MDSNRPLTPRQLATQVHADYINGKIGLIAAVEVAITQALADEHERAMESAAVICEAADSCETDLGWTDCPQRYAAAIRAAAKGK